MAIVNGQQNDKTTNSSDFATLGTAPNTSADVNVHAPDFNSGNFNGFNVNAQPQPNLGAQNYTGFSNPQPQPQRNLYSDITVGGGILLGSELDVPWSAASGKVKDIANALKEIAEQTPSLTRKEDTWGILEFDGPSRQANVSAVIFYRRNADGVAVFPLLLQATAEQLPEKALFNGSILVPQLTEELLTSESDLQENICDYVRTQLEGADTFYVSALVLPSDLNKDNVVELRRVLLYANSATQTLISALAGKPRIFSLAQRASNERFAVRYDYNPGSISNSVGTPVRSDVQIKLMLRKQQNNNQRSLSSTASALLSVASGYMQLQYIGGQNVMLDPTNPMSQFMRQPLFQPIFVVNRLDNQFSGATLESQLLALASAGSLTYNNAWMNIYTPNYALTEPGSDPKDIGNITAGANFPGLELKPTATKTNEFNLPLFLSQYLKNELLYYIDVPELGDLSYIQRVFLDYVGLSNSKDSAAIREEARAAIFHAANILTYGKFQEIWDRLGGGNEDIVVNQVGRIELGYYVTQKGEKRDLHEIDYLMLISYAGIEQANAYMDSLNPATGDEIKRFAVRQEIYKTYFSGYELTGFARRLTINPKFMIALGSAVSAVSGDIDVEQLIHTNATVDRTYHSMFSGVPMNAISGFTTGYSYGNGNQVNQPWRYLAPQQVNIWANGQYNAATVGQPNNFSYAIPTATAPVMAY